MDKEQTAMERLRLASDMSLRLYHRPLLLTDSGGKDSAVICKLAENNILRSELRRMFQLYVAAEMRADTGVSTEELDNGDK